MTPSCTPSIEQIKSGAKAIKSTLQNRFSIAVNHTQALELSSVAYGYKDFHVASAALEQKRKTGGQRKPFEIKEEHIIKSMFKHMALGRMRKVSHGEKIEEIEAIILKYENVGLEYTEQEMEFVSNEIKKYVARYVMGYGEGESVNEAMRIATWHFDTLGGNPFMEFDREYKSALIFQKTGYVEFVHDLCENFGGKEKYDLKSAWRKYAYTKKGNDEIMKAIKSEDLVTDEILFILKETKESFMHKSAIQKEIYADMLRYAPWLKQILHDLEESIRKYVYSTSGVDKEIDWSSLITASRFIEKPEIYIPYWKTIGSKEAS